MVSSFCLITELEFLHETEPVCHSCISACAGTASEGEAEGCGRLFHLKFLFFLFC